MADRTNKCVCRLCYYETIDTVDIFSQKGIDFDYEGKITKYLYLSVSLDDRFPRTVCWMCTQNLETFHRFYEKINEIQRSTLQEDYDSIVIRSHFDADPSIVDSATKGESDKKTLIDDDGNIYEIIISSVKNDVISKDDDTEMEEYELLEVDVCDNERIDDDNQTLSETFESAIPVEDDEIDLAIVSNNQTADLSMNSNNEARESPALPLTRRSNRLQEQTAEKIFVEQRPERVVKKKKSLNQLKSKNRSVEPMESTSSTKAESENNLQYDNDDVQEGESDDEFPNTARNSDDEDWPSQMTLDEFPKEIIRDGLLLIKGKPLMSMICQFYNLECKKCGKKRRFRHLNALFEHYKKHHKEPGYLECCQTKLARQPAIIMHMARHLQPDAFKCDECGYIVTRPRFLQSHKQTHLPEDQKPYACPQDGCTRKFCWKSALRIHLISHQPASERKQYICQCGRSYDTPGGLSTHKKQVHAPKSSNMSSNICHICSKHLATRTSLQEHIQTIHQPREKGQVQCNECGKWLMNYRCLKTHMILHSNIELRCDQCDYVTKKKVLLNRHLLTQHSNEKPFICNLCGRSFKMKRALTVHLAQHGTKTVWKCSFCTRVFNSSTNFYTHRKNSHPKELNELLRKKAEDQRQKRIEAGTEQDPNAEEVLNLQI